MYTFVLCVCIYIYICIGVSPELPPLRVLDAAPRQASGAAGSQAHQLGRLRYV